MTDVAPEPRKHTLTSALKDAKEKEQSGDYYVGSFFEDDPETPTQEAYLPVTHDFGEAWVSGPPESDAQIVLEIGDTADHGEPSLLEMGETYREIKSASWDGFVEELAERGVTIDMVFAKDKHPMAQGTLYIAVPSMAEEKKALSRAENLIEELSANEEIQNL
jgi:hypothetical protein